MLLYIALSLISPSGMLACHHDNTIHYPPHMLMYAFSLCDLTNALHHHDVIHARWSMSILFLVNMSLASEEVINLPSFVDVYFE